MIRDERWYYARLVRVVEAKGGRVEEEKWLGSHVRHRIRCHNGHLHEIFGDNALRQGLCADENASGKYVPGAAFAEFKAGLAALGARLANSNQQWLGPNVPYDVICVNGHLGHPHPSTVQQGKAGICWKCGQEKIARINTAKGVVQLEKFRTDLAELGTTLSPAEKLWRGSTAAYLATCARSHECYPTPNRLQQGRGIQCWDCSVITWCQHHPWSQRAEAEFRAWLADHDAELLEPWHGVMKNHLVQCKRPQHLAHGVKPNNVQGGQGICRLCAWEDMDVFYVLTGPKGLKFGITSGDPRPRLRDHQRDGYCAVIHWLSTGLDQGVPIGLETDIKQVLRKEGFVPVEGDEHFGADALGRVLGITGKTLGRNRNEL